MKKGVHFFKKNLMEFFSPQPILVVGDFMVDKYSYGKVSRISPEAPVPVLHVHKQTMQPGGAGNVVRNLLTLGALPHALGRVGKDSEGDFLLDWLKQSNVNVRSFLQLKNSSTTLKNRLIADRQQLVRLDFEESAVLGAAEEKKLMGSLGKIISQVKTVAVSDYKKGFLTDKLLQALIAEAKNQKVPLIVDPKGINFSKYRHATMIKPNLSEAYLAANLPQSSSLQEVANVLWKHTACDYLLITRSRDGMSLFEKNKKQKDFPIIADEIIDATGAGDTVQAVLSIALANGCNLDDAIHLANAAAQITVQHVGCYGVSLSDLFKKLYGFHAQNKIFTKSHLFALKEILKKESFSLLAIDAKEDISYRFFQIIQKLAQESMVVVYVKGENPHPEWLLFLASLKEVGLIIQEEKNLESLIKQIHPHKVFWMENDQIREIHPLHEVFGKLGLNKSSSKVHA